MNLSQQKIRFRKGVFQKKKSKSKRIKTEKEIPSEGGKKWRKQKKNVATIDCE